MHKNVVEVLKYCTSAYEMVMETLDFLLFACVNQHHAPFRNRALTAEKYEHIHEN